MPQGDASLSCLDLPKTAATSPGAARPPASPTQQLSSGWLEFLRLNNSSAWVSPGCSSPAMPGMLPIPLYLNSVLDTKSAKTFNLVRCELQ